MASTFYAQIYCWVDNRLSLTDATPIQAPTHDAAAEIACGKGVIRVGLAGKLAAKIWRVGIGGQPDIQLYYRP